MAFTEKHFLSLNSRGAHRIVYNDWGPEDGQIMICVHGLTGNGHDFDYLAEILIDDGYRLICVDLPGRGRSDFLPNPLDYNYNQYSHDLMALLAHLNITEAGIVDWLGISLGGLLGIKLAGIENSPIRRLIINDVGPEVPQAALDFIHQVISQSYVFDTIKGLENRMRETRGLTWGPVTDEQWHHMAEHNARALEDGSITYSYDPEIAVIFEEEPIGAEDLWLNWDQIACPVLTIRGAQSVLLTKDILKEMKSRGPGPAMSIEIFKGCGHVPSLMAPKQIQAIQKWLKKKN